jgi:hypothetical protein
MKKLILLLFLIPAHLFAADEQVNEDELFSGSETVVENKQQDSTVNDIQNKRSIAISGEITSAVSYSKVDESSENSMSDMSTIRPYILGDLYFDARLPGGYKGFGSFELKHDASIDEDETGEKQTTYSVKELFVDFNFNRYVYFRTGKQVLQWGQCYLWNPTDMINIENKSFLNKLEAREGTYGVKGHIPFGTAVNIYGFADLNQVNEGGDVAGSGKFEFLIQGTEMAFSAWGKKKFNPVYGYDFSGRLLGIDVKGEASYSKGSNTEKVVNNSGVLSAVKDEESDIYKASINFGRDFDFGDKADIINISIELFYNGDGYKENPLEDEGLYLYDEPVVYEKNKTTYTIPGGDMKTYLLGHGLYEANYFSEYYAALFITWKEFIISDITLTLNGIANIPQKSYIVSSGLSYTNINDFTAGATVNGYLGDEYGEYRAGGIKYDVLVTAGILF